MKILLSHPTANNFTRAIAEKLIEKDLLFAFYTSVANFEGSWIDNFSFLPFLSEVRRRRFDSMLKPYTKTYPWIEIGRQISSKMGLKKLTAHESGLFCIDEVYHHLDKKIARSLSKNLASSISGVYAYEDGALATFQKSKELSLHCIYDLPIAYWETGKKLMAEEADRLPQWAPTLMGGIKDSIQKLERKQKELELADTVIVPSQFVEKSLPDWAKTKKIIIAPFGSPKLNKTNNIQKKNDERRLRVLFAGSMGQRKGLGDLFAAMKYFKPSEVELVVMGSLQSSLDFYRQELPYFTYEPGRSNEQVLALMRTCDIFCLPSIVEGRALVMQEAMSQGLPILITPNTGGEDLVIEGETGFMVPIRSPEKIAEKINWFVENRALLQTMGVAAQQHAVNYTWDKYGDTIVGRINEIVQLNYVK